MPEVLADPNHEFPKRRGRKSKYPWSDLTNGEKWTLKVPDEVKNPESWRTAAYKRGNDENKSPKFDMNDVEKNGKGEYSGSFVVQFLPRPEDYKPRKRTKKAKTAKNEGEGK